MIALARKGRQFAPAAAYLVRDEGGLEHHRVAWIASRNLPTNDPDLAVTFMRATAAQSATVEKPVYNLVLAFAPEDPVDRAMMERVADRLLARVGLSEHQALLVAHRNQPEPHVHIMVNRVHPETGRAQGSWRDWNEIEQVLWEEERTLGLRESPHYQRRARRRVPGVARDPASQRSTEPGLPGRPEPGAEAPAHNAGPAEAVPLKSTPVEDLGREVRAYERVLELTREAYEAQIEASAARARGARLAQEAERAHVARAHAQAALARVYQDPDQAYRAYLSSADRQGLPQATRSLGHDPRQFGTLVTVRPARAFALLPGSAERAARERAPQAATAAQGAVEATRAWHAAALAEARRADAAFERDLAALYRAPAAARAEFERLAAEHSAAQAARALRSRPRGFGPLLPTQGDAGPRERLVARTAACGAEALAARAAASAAGSGGPLHSAPEPSYGEAERAMAREQAAREALRALPSRAELEGRIAEALARLLPRELGRLRTILTAPQLALTTKLRRTLRDVALGTEEERTEPSP